MPRLNKKAEEKQKARLIFILSVARIAAEITMIVGFFVLLVMLMKWGRLF